MRLEDQCCTAEQSQKLMELGLSAKSEFHWVLNSAREYWKVTRKGAANDFSFLPHLEAYTVAELSILLPSEYLDSSGEYYQIFFYKEGGIFYTAFGPLNNGKFLARKMFVALEESKSKADALIWILDNTSLKAEELKL
jgi:hypothetical protein